MSDRVFIDTNIFVYADDDTVKGKRDRARETLAPLLRTRRAVVSTQVMQEYFVTATKKLRLSPAQARRRVEQLERLDVILVRPELVLGAIDLHRLHDLSFWDALIIKAASVGGCARLLSEDLNYGQVIDGVMIENPFAPATRAGEPRARYGMRPARRPARRCPK
jgi:predicted nucleic acid-binding protein